MELYMTAIENGPFDHPEPVTRIVLDLCAMEENCHHSINSETPEHENRVSFLNVPIRLY